VVRPIQRSCTARRELLVTQDAMTQAVEATAEDFKLKLIQSD
jgi:hypothetical protein